MPFSANRLQLVQSETLASRETVLPLFPIQLAQISDHRPICKYHSIDASRIKHPVRSYVICTMPRPPRQEPPSDAAGCHSANSGSTSNTSASSSAARHWREPSSHPLRGASPGQLGLRLVLPPRHSAARHSPPRREPSSRLPTWLARRITWPARGSTLYFHLVIRSQAQSSEA